MLTHGLSEDRLRYQSSVREEVIKTAHKYQVKLEHAERRDICSQPFDQTQGLHTWGQNNKRPNALHTVVFMWSFRPSQALLLLNSATVNYWAIPKLKLKSLPT